MFRRPAPKAPLIGKRFDFHDRTKCYGCNRPPTGTEKKAWKLCNTKKVDPEDYKFFGREKCAGKWLCVNCSTGINNARMHVSPKQNTPLRVWDCLLFFDHLRDQQYRPLSQKGVFEYPKCGTECIKALDGCSIFSDSSHTWLHIEKEAFGNLYVEQYNSWSYEVEMPDGQPVSSRIRKLKFCGLPVSAHYCLDCAEYWPKTRGVRPPRPEEARPEHSCKKEVVSKRLRESNNDLPIPTATLDSIASEYFSVCGEELLPEVWKCTNSVNLGTADMELTMKCKFECQDPEKIATHKKACQLGRKDHCASKIVKCLSANEMMSPVIASCLNKLNNEQPIPGVDLIDRNLVLRSCNKYQLGDSRVKLFTNSLKTRSGFSNTCEWNFESVIGLIGEYAPRSKVENFIRQLRHMNLHSPTKLKEKLFDKRREIRSFVRAQLIKDKNQEDILAVKFADRAFDDFFASVCAESNVLHHTQSFSLLLDEGFRSSKATVMLNTPNHQNEKNILLGVAHGRESDELYTNLLTDSGLSTILGTAKVLDVPVFVGGDIKSLNALTGTSSMANYPCPLCKTEKKKEQRQIVNHDEFYGQVGEPRTISDYDDNSEVRKDKRHFLKSLSPIVETMMEEQGHTRLDKMIGFAPLHWRLSYHKYFELGKKVSPKFGELMEAISSLRTYKGATLWYGTDITKIWRQVGSLEDQLIENGETDTVLLEFVRGTCLYRDVNHRMMGKTLLQGWRESRQQFQALVVDRLWREHNGPQNLYLHAMLHMDQLVEEHGVGLASIINDEAMEKVHQRYDQHMRSLKAGKLDESKLAADYLNNPSSFAGKNVDAFGRMNLAVLNARPLKELKNERKLSQTLFTAVDLKNTWN